MMQEKHVCKNKDYKTVLIWNILLLKEINQESSNVTLSHSGHNSKKIEMSHDSQTNQQFLISTL